MLRALALALALAACASPPVRTLGGMDLDATHWRALEFDIPADVTPPTMSFEVGRASGSTGCNHWSARVDADGLGNMRFGSISVTEMACAAPAMDVERRFIERLQMTRAVDVDAAPMTLRLIGPEADHLISFDAWQPPG